MLTSLGTYLLTTMQFTIGRQLLMASTTNSKILIERHSRSGTAWPGALKASSRENQRVVKEFLDTGQERPVRFASSAVKKLLSRNWPPANSYITINARIYMQIQTNRELRYRTQRPCDRIFKKVLVRFDSVSMHVCSRRVGMRGTESEAA